MAADDEIPIKVKIEADTSEVDAALKKTASDANKIASKTASFDKTAIATSKELRKEAVRAAKINETSLNSGVKAGALEDKNLNKQIQMNKKRMAQATQMFKLNNKDFLLKEKAQKKELQTLRIQNNALKIRKQGVDLATKGGTVRARMGKDGRILTSDGREITDEEEKKQFRNRELRGRDGGNAEMAKTVARVIAGVAKQVADFVIQPMMQGYQSYLQYGKTLGRTIGQGNVDSINFGLAESLAFSKQETAQQAYGVARSTGRLGAVGTAQQTARFYGGSVEEAAGFMGTLTRGGSRFSENGGGQGRTVLFRTLRDATASGLDRSRVGEHLEAVAGAIEMTSQSMAGDVSASNISGLLALIGSSGRSGFQGARGMNVLSQIDQGMKSGGRDEYSSARQLAAFGFGVPGQDTDYYDAIRRRDMGIFGGQGNEGAQNLVAMMQNFLSANMGNMRASVVDARESGLFGNLGIDQIESLFNTFQSTGGNLDAVTTAIDDLRSSQGSVEEQIRDNLKTGQALVASRVAGIDNRLVGIGERVFPAMANIQDAVMELQNTLLPDAIEILSMISDGVTAIRDFIISPMEEQRMADRASDRNMQSASEIRGRIQNAQTIEEAEAALAEYRNLERRVDREEHRAYEGGHTATGETLQNLGDRLHEMYSKNLIPSVEAIRQRETAEARLQQIQQPTQTAPIVQVAPPAVTVNTNVNTGNPNDARVPVTPDASGVAGGNGW